MASTDTYKGDITKLCNQIESIRVKSCVGSRVFQSKRPACLPQSLAPVRPGVFLSSGSAETNLSQAVTSELDGDSLILFQKLKNVSIKLNELEETMHIVHKCPVVNTNDQLLSENELACKIENIVESLNEVKKQGKLLHFSLDEEEKELNREIDKLSKSVSEYEKYICKKSCISNKIIKNNHNMIVQNRAKSLSASNMALNLDHFKLDELNIWDPVEYKMLEKVCSQHESFNTCLTLCHQIMPVKTTTEIVAYIKKYQKDIDRKMKVRKQIIDWKNSQLKSFESRSNNFYKSNDSNTVKSKRKIPMPVISKSVQRLSALSQKRPHTAAVIPTKYPKSFEYTDIERRIIKQKIERYKQLKSGSHSSDIKINYSHFTTKQNRQKINEFQKRDEQFLNDKMKAIEQKRVTTNTEQFVRSHSITKWTGENSFMRLTLSRSIAMKSNNCKKSFTCYVSDVDSIPKRKIPQWRAGLN